MPTNQFDKNQHSSDQLMFHVKQMAVEDIEFAVRLTDTMNWNLTEHDFKFMMSLEPKGCFVLLHNSKRIGITTTISFDKLGWIGNVIVDKNYRRKGAGSTLLKKAIKYLKKKGVRTIGLYSYKKTDNFYKRLGFKRDLEFTVLKGHLRPSSVKENNVQKTSICDVQRIVDFDSFYFGAPRKKLLEKIANKKGNLCYCYVYDRGILGYLMVKVYNGYAEIGPLVFRRENSYAATDLLSAVLKKLDGFEISVCLPKKEENLVDMFLNSGLKEDFDVVRMFSGPLVFKDCIYIAESLERG